MWMNEHEVERARELYADHAVLGPATATLAELVDWTNSNSDGWPYWRKPAQAAAQLMGLIGTMRDYDVRGAERADVTPEKYKAALRPLKSFRTRWFREHSGQQFRIYDPLAEGESGRTFAAGLAYEEAVKLHESLQQRERAARELRDRAYAELSRLREHDALAELHAQYEAGTIRPDLVTLGMFEPGARIYRLPHFLGSESGQFDGLGQVVTVTGLSYGMSGARLAFVTDDGTPGIEHNPMTETEAKLRWWILDAEGANLVSGGTRDEARMHELAAERYPGAIVRQGREFIGRVPATTAAEG